MKKLGSQVCRKWGTARSAWKMPIMTRKNTSRYPMVSPNTVNVKLCPHAVSDSGSHASSINTQLIPRRSNCGVCSPAMSSPANSTGVPPGALHALHLTRPSRARREVCGAVGDVTHPGLAEEHVEDREAVREHDVIGVGPVKGVGGAIRALVAAQRTGARAARVGQRRRHPHPGRHRRDVRHFISRASPARASLLRNMRNRVIGVCHVWQTA